jgi:hypothetical protein
MHIAWGTTTVCCLLCSMLRGAPAGLASLLLLAYRLYLITKMNKDLTLSLGLKILSQAQSCAISLVDKADLAHTTSKNESKFEALLVAGPPNDTAKAETRPFPGRTHQCVSGIWGLIVCPPDDCSGSSRVLLCLSNHRHRRGNIEDAPYILEMTAG